MERLNHSESKSLKDFRIQMLNNILWTLVILGSIATSLASVHEFRQGAYVLVFLYIATFSGAVAITSFRSLGYAVRAAACLLMIYGIAFSELYFFGITALSYPLMYTFVLFSGILFGMRAGIGAMTLVFGSYFFRFYFDFQRLRAASAPENELDGALLDWLSSTMSFGFLTAIAVVATTMMLNNLTRSLQETQGLVGELQTEVNARAEVERALVASETRYRLLAEQGSEVIWETDLAGTCIYIAPSINQVFGWNHTDILKGWLFDRLLLDESKSKIKEMMTELVSGHVVEIVADERFLNISGELKWGELRMVALKDDANTVTAIQGVIKDISNKKELEEQLIQSQKMEAIGQLAGGIAHDFNNLLTGTSGGAELLRQEKNLTQTSKSALEIIEECNERGAQLVRRLLDFGRKGMGGRNRIDLHGVLTTVEKILQHSLDSSIDVTFRYDATESEINGDANQLENAFLNLCLNARDAMGNGGTLLVRTKNSLAAEDSGRNPIVVEVQDTGNGIEPAVLGHIFEPFFTTKPIGKGTGLGLSSVKGCIEAHNGEISVESTVGEGTTFRVEIPL